MTANNPLGSSFRVPFTDTRDYNQGFAEGFAEDLQSVLQSGRYILGDQVAAFEKKLAEAVGANHAIAVSSGTAALELAFRALNLAPTDEIIVPANAYIASIFGAMASGARIVPVDCELDGTLDLDEVASHVTHRTKAVLVVHLYGDSCNMAELSEFCQDRGIVLIEDCAQSFGTSYAGRPHGSFGDMACFSFYPTKNLGALGDAGAITTNRPGYALACRQMRNLGSTVKYIHDIQGTNARMDTLQAAFLLRKFDDMTRVINEKRTIAAQYTQDLSLYHIRNNDPRVRHSYHLYVLATRNRERICKALAAKGIETILHYPIPFYKSSAFHWLNHLSFPNTEVLAKTVFSIPLYASLTQKDIDHVIQSVLDETSHSSL